MDSPQTASQHATLNQDARPTLVFVYGKTSGPSRRAEAFLAQVLQRRRNHDTFDLVRVCAETHPEMVERLGVAVVPTILVFDRGTVQARVEAPKGRAPIESALAPWLS